MANKYVNLANGASATTVGAYWVGGRAALALSGTRDDEAPDLGARRRLVRRRDDQCGGLVVLRSSPWELPNESRRRES